MENKTAELTAEEISQWVIEKRVAPYKGERMTDTELFNLLSNKIKAYASIREEKAFNAGIEFGIKNSLNIMRCKDKEDRKLLENKGLEEYQKHNLFS